MPNEQSKLLIHIGCGNKVGESWRNFDSSPYVRLRQIPVIGRISRLVPRNFHPAVKYGDITSGVLCEPGTADAIFASHVLEHLSFDDAQIALRNIRSMLSAGGVFRVVVPDLNWRTRLYNDQIAEGDPEAANRFVAGLNIGAEHSRRGVRARLRSSMSNARHQWMYDELSLEKILLGHGFSEVRRCAFGDSGLNYFGEVENTNRFVDEPSGEPELAFHCIA